MADEAAAGRLASRPRLDAVRFAPLSRQPGTTSVEVARATEPTEAGSVRGGVRWLLRLEGLAVLGLAVSAYAGLGAGWGAFAALFLLPDLAFAAYLAGPRAGALAYNATHSYLGALGLLAIGLLGAVPTATAGALVWCAHIGFDRALGYGLKYARGFDATHLGRLGRADPW